MTVRPMAGTAPTVTATIRDVDGELTDPAGVEFTVQAPDDTQTTYVYGVDAEVDRVSVGVYTLTVVIPAAGRHVVHIETSGTTTVVEETVVWMREAEVTVGP